MDKVADDSNAREVVIDSPVNAGKREWGQRSVGGGLATRTFRLTYRRTEGRPCLR